jgi:hypothetical protein
LFITEDITLETIGICFQIVSQWLYGKSRKSDLLAMFCGYRGW